MTFKLKLLLGVLLVLGGWLGFKETAVHAQEDLFARLLTFRSGETALAGTLYLPQDAGPFPTVMIMRGAGPETRQLYFSDAEMLATNGNAAFIFDKRGTGASGGDWWHSSLDDLTSDGLVTLLIANLI